MSSFLPRPMVSATAVCYSFSSYERTAGHSAPDRSRAAVGGRLALPASIRGRHRRRRGRRGARRVGHSTVRADSHPHLVATTALRAGRDYLVLLRRARLVLGRGLAAVPGSVPDSNDN